MAFSATPDVEEMPARAHSKQTTAKPAPRSPLFGVHAEIADPQYFVAAPEEGEGLRVRAPMEEVTKQAPLSPLLVSLRGNAAQESFTNSPPVRLKDGHCDAQGPKAGKHIFSATCRAVPCGAGGIHVPAHGRLHA